MDLSRPMTLLLVEDDVSECVAYKECALRRNDVRFVGMTGSDIEGINYVKAHNPEGVILDIELHNGHGSGISFLTEMKKLSPDYKPLIIVVTKSSSDVVLSYAHNNGADLVFYKKQSDYSPDMVINTFITLRESVYDMNKGKPKDKVTTAETPGERRNRIDDQINKELNLIGIGKHLLGRKYLHYAIFNVIESDADEEREGSVFAQLAAQNKRSSSSVNRAMQTAINTAWRTTCIDDLQLHYTARVNYKTGVPTPTEFIYYYADKIMKSL